MRFLKSLLLASSCLLSSVSAAASAAAHGDDKGCVAATAFSHTHVERYAMGFEVETSGIKVQHTDEDEILVILESTDGKWQLTTDTQDKRIDSTNWVNLECRTVGGLTQEEIIKYIAITQKLMRKIKEACDAEANGQICFDRSLFNNFVLFQSDIQWGSNDLTKRSLEQVTFATKRKITDSSVDKIKLMTSYDDCVEVFVFAASDNTIGIEVKLAHGKHLDNAAALIAQLIQKLTHEFNTMARITGSKGWQLDNISIASLYGKTLKDHLFKPGLPLGTALTFSTNGVFASLDDTLRPQLTFSFPMKETLTVFRRVLSQEHASYVAPRICRIEEEINTLQEKIKSINEYLEENKNIGRIIINRKIAEKEKHETDRNALKEFQELTRELRSKLFESKTNFHGFCILVLEYVVDLFVLNRPLPNVSETGPKASLKVVSRLPFSEMFQQFNEEEKENFRVFIAKIDLNIQTRLVKPYRKDSPDRIYELSKDKKTAMIDEDERQLLFHWLQSIANPFNRGRSLEEHPLHRDLLSPPLYTARNYSMGAVVMSPALKFRAIIEARGYGSLLICSQAGGKSDCPVSVDNIVNLINDEARKFFSLTKGDQ